MADDERIKLPAINMLCFDDYSEEEGGEGSEESKGKSDMYVMDQDVQSVDFSKTLSYELYKLKDPRKHCLIYDKGLLFGQVTTTAPLEELAFKEMKEKKKKFLIDPCAPSTSKLSSEKSKDQLIEVTKKDLKDVRTLYETLASEKRKYLEKVYTIMKPKVDPKKYIYKTTDSQTDSYTCTCSSSDAMLMERKKLEYLMGHDAAVDEFAKPIPKKELEEIIYEEPVEEQISGLSESMRQAQKYLRTHRIFEFFQFLITHLLSATPADPIAFLTNLLDKCLIYRGGFTYPPLLYEKKHLECLFNLMDPMRTGFIELEQYKTGMHTLGICSFNPKPPLNVEGIIGKDFFVEEAYDALTNLLNDMIRRRWIGPIKKADVKPPPPTPVTLSTTKKSTITKASTNNF